MLFDDDGEVRDEERVIEQFTGRALDPTVGDDLVVLVHLQLVGQAAVEELPPGRHNGGNVVVGHGGAEVCENDVA